MKARMGQYLNEVVSLSIMLLMAIALIAAQAGASSPDIASDEADFVAAPTSIVDATAVFEANLPDVGHAVLSLHFDMVLDEVLESLPSEETAEVLGDVVRIRLSSDK